MPTAQQDKTVMAKYPREWEDTVKEAQGRAGQTQSDWLTDLIGREVDLERRRQKREAATSKTAKRVRRAK